MDRRARIFVMIFVIVSLIGVAIGSCSIVGCLGGNDNPGNQTPTPTETSTPTQTITPTPTETAGNGTYGDYTLPKGVRKNNINGTVYAKTLRSMLSSYELDYKVVIKDEKGNNNTILEEIKVNGKTAMIKRNAVSTRSEIWLNETIVAKASGITERNYIVTNKTKYSESIKRVELDNLLNSGNFSAVETVERNNRTFIRFEANVPSKTADKNLFGSSVNNYQGTVILSTDGYIRAYSFSYDTDVGGKFRSITISGSYSNIGNTTVEKPPWIDDAFSEAPKVNILRSNDFATISHNGGRSIPNGSVYLVKVGNQSLRTEMNEKLEKGEVWYIYKKNNSLHLTGELPDERQKLPSGDIVVVGQKFGGEILRAYDIQRKEEN